jgi:hypothetical protein
MKKLQLKLKQSVELIQAARMIHKLALDGATVRLNRRVQRMIDVSDNLKETDVYTILKKCRVTRILGGSVLENFHYRVEGSTADEEGVELVVRVERHPAEMQYRLAVIDARWLDEEGKSHEEKMQKVRVEFKKRSISKIRR